MQIIDRNLISIELSHQINIVICLVSSENLVFEKFYFICTLNMVKPVINTLPIFTFTFMLTINCQTMQATKRLWSQTNIRLWNESKQNVTIVYFSIEFKEYKFNLLGWNFILITAINQDSNVLSDIFRINKEYVDLRFRHLYIFRERKNQEINTLTFWRKKKTI